MLVKRRSDSLPNEIIVLAYILILVIRIVSTTTSLSSHIQIGDIFEYATKGTTVNWWSTKDMSSFGDTKVNSPTHLLALYSVVVRMTHIVTNSSCVASLCCILNHQQISE
jgi:hypothetical protein